MKILGVRIDQAARQEALDKVLEFLSSDGQHMIFTPNPEMLVAAHRDPYFQDILNESSLNICDGRGVELALKLKNNSSKLERIPGMDFMRDICCLAAEHGSGVYLLGSGDKNVIKSSSVALKEEFSNLKIVGYHPGPELRIMNYSTSERYPACGGGELQYNEKENDEILSDIIMTAPHILFVGFGHEKQEKWIYEHLPQLPSVKVAMGVGGVFDVFGEKLKRAPRSMQVAGMEWLWRLIQEPKRISRIWIAVVIFPYLVIKNSKTA